MTSRPLVVAAHGWLLSRKVWQPLEQQWTLRDSMAKDAEATWRLWCPDLPGFGTRPRPSDLRPNLASYGRWLAAQALEQANGAPLLLMGHSLGASVVLHAAHHLQANAPQQCQGVICVAAGGGIYQPRPFRRVRQGGRWAVRLRPSIPLTLGPFQAEERAALGLLVNSTCRGAIRQIPRLVANLSMPSLWISGSRDQVMEPNYVHHLAGYSRDHTVVTLERCGHLPMRTHAQELRSTIQSWMTKTIGPV